MEMGPPASRGAVCNIHVCMNSIHIRMKILFIYLILLHYSYVYLIYVTISLPQTTVHMYLYRIPHGFYIFCSMYLSYLFLSLLYN